MPLRELKHPRQVEAWLEEWGTLLTEPGSLTLIGSGGLLWHAAQRGIDNPLPENSMDVDLVTQSDSVALLGYEAMIGSDFEKRHNWQARRAPR
jgi:hypothetical protein